MVVEGGVEVPAGAPGVEDGPGAGGATGGGGGRGKGGKVVLVSIYVKNLSPPSSDVPNVRVRACVRLRARLRACVSPCLLSPQLNVTEIQSVTSDLRKVREGGHLCFVGVDLGVGDVSEGTELEGIEKEK